MTTRWRRSAPSVAPFAFALLVPASMGACSSSGDEPLATGADAATTQITGVTFRTAIQGKYVGALNNGGGAVTATATAAREWETFVLLDKNGGAITSGDEVFVQTGAGPYFQAVNGGGGDLNAASPNQLAWETFRIVKDSGGGPIHAGDVVGLQTITGNWVSAQNGGGGPVFAYGAALGPWERFVFGAPVSAADAGAPADAAAPTPDGESGAPPDFGPNVFVFDPSMSNASIQQKIDKVYKTQANNQFGGERYAYLFKPGTYDLDVQVGFYMHVAGLGRSPDDVKITGAVRSKADWFGGNATQNFWRTVENMAVVPIRDGNANVWAVSQATSFRRMHVMGSMNLSDNGWSSGGFIADSKFDVALSSGTQQQFLTRNSALTRWNGGSWNMVFVGDTQAPGGAWPSTSYTVLDRTPIIREKPYLVIDGAGRYSVIVPGLATGTQGTTWAAVPSAGSALSTDTFYVAHEGRDTADTLNAALAQGKNLLFTPGVYHLASTLQVSRPGTIALGLGLATLVPDAGNVTMAVADVDGVIIAGLLFEAGTRESPTLLRIGEAGSTRSHAAAPTSLHDLSCRVGGAGAGTTSSCLTINSNDVIADNLWLWRADHGDGVDWNVNKAKNGIIVNGNDVTAYGLFVEHFQEYQTIWNGNGGRVYFYQSELPYDPPSQGAWRHGNVDGWASYKVGDNVTTHDAWGLGVYCVFYNPVAEANAIETPSRSGVTFHHMITEWLGVADTSSIDHIINGTGGSATAGNRQAKTSY